jgi:hypothetical protein
MENFSYIERLGMVYQEVQQLGQKVIFKEIGEEFQVIIPLN